MWAAVCEAGVAFQHAGVGLPPPACTARTCLKQAYAAFGCLDNPDLGGADYLLISLCRDMPMLILPKLVSTSWLLASLPRPVVDCSHRFPHVPSHALLLTMLTVALPAHHQIIFMKTM